MFPFQLSFFDGDAFKFGIPRFVWSVVIFLFCSSVLLRNSVRIIPGEFRLNWINLIRSIKMYYLLNESNEEKRLNLFRETRLYYS